MGEPYGGTERDEELELGMEDVQLSDSEIAELEADVIRGRERSSDLRARLVEAPTVGTGEFVAETVARHAQARATRTLRPRSWHAVCRGSV
jgi:hypothetical protein